MHCVDVYMVFIFNVSGVEQRPVIVMHLYDTLHTICNALPDEHTIYYYYNIGYHMMDSRKALFIVHMCTQYP